MSLTVPQQIKQLIENKKNILITMRKNATGDAIASALALYLFLKKQDKNIDLVVDDFVLPQKMSFLKHSDEFKGQFSHLQKFIITVDVKNNGVEELSYDLKEEKLRIYVTPKQGFLNKDHIRTAQSDFKYELIFVLDSPDLESLGKIYDNNTELFYKTTVINIDHSPANEHYGQINVNELTVPSTAEVIFDILKKIGQELIDADVATALLAGMISATRSFKSDNVKPHTLATASTLMGLGGDREKVVTNLYKTRSVKALKLWGQALTQMQNDTKIKMVWSTITRDDFVRNDATETDLKDIIDELISNSPDAKITLLLHEHPDNPVIQTIHGMLHLEDKNLDGKKLLAGYDPQGTKHDVSFSLVGKTLKMAEQEIVGYLRKKLEEKTV